MPSLKEKTVQRVLAVFAFIVVATLASASQSAGSDPFLGTWKLNVAKSKYVNAPPAPKSETRTVEAVGSGAKFSLKGIDADGSRIDYSYTTNFDGKDTPVIGADAANAEDSIAIKRVDAYTFTATTKRAGKVIRNVRGVVSQDGKVTRLVAKGTDAQGRPATAITIWEKQ
jgi:hypothetical protein